MKKTILLFIAFFLFAKITLAQNWTPLNQSDKYHFQNDTSNYISNTLWIDSVEVIDNDSIFYLNRVVLVCDTCQNNAGNLPNYKLANQGQFLQKQMIKKSNNDFIFQGNHNFLLRPNASVGESWLADTLNNISAEVLLANEQNIFGNLDSVKTIQLSNGKEILISKNYGFVSFTDFENEVSFDLQGIEGRDLGELVPDMFDFYNFEVGDVFQYRFHSGSCCPFYYVDDLWKETILSKTIYADSIVYEIETVRNQSINIVESTKVITNESIHPTNLFSQQLTTSPHPETDKIEYSYDAVNLFRDSNQLITKTFGTFEILGANIYFQVKNYFKENDSDILEAADYNSSFHIYKNGLGEIRNGFVTFEYASSFELEGYVKNGDTTGTIYSDIDVINSIETQEDFPFKIIISPNPASNFFHVYFPQPINENLSLQIFSLDGKLVLQKEIQRGNPGFELNVNTLLQGIYFVKIKGEKIHGIKKLIIQKE